MSKPEAGAGAAGDGGGVMSEHTCESGACEWECEAMLSRERMAALESELLDAALEAARMRNALRAIADWRVPAGPFRNSLGDVIAWDDGTPMRFQDAFGSNGEREHFRRIARVALGTEAPPK